MGWAGPITHRQYTTWLYWSALVDSNEPDRGDNYLMQISAQLHILYHAVIKKNPGEIDVNKFKVTFRPAGQRQRPKTKEEAGRLARARWNPIIDGATPQSRRFKGK
jgi:hypothetical protein